MPRPNILIVDDVPVNIKVLLTALISDYDLSAATSGPDAIEIAVSDSPDLILLDIMMPEMSGYEVCAHLKADPRTQGIPIIFITARNEEEEETRGFELGAVDYITKPFSPAIVKARLRTHIELKRHRDHLEELNTLLIQEVAERKRSEEALKYLLKKQDINIEMAKKLLKRVNGTVPRYIRLPENLVLFADAISIPCYAEGGDHYFVRAMSPDKQNRYGKILLSLKDQSGHEVTCVLRSIMTDMIHNAILDNDGATPLEEGISKLNDEICHSKIFSEEDFFTSVSAEIDRETLVMRYVSTGHPPFLLIRGNKVDELPELGGAGTNIPVAVRSGIAYSVGETQLQEGDKLIFYTDGLTEMPLKNRKEMIKLKELKQLVGDIIRQPTKCFRSGEQEGGMTGGRKQYPELSVSDIMNNLLIRISEISGEEVVPHGCKDGPKNTSADDITILCLEIENRNNYYENIWKPKDSDDIARRIAGLCEKLECEWNYYDCELPQSCLRMVLEEALLNAWVHGNHQNPDKSVIVRWRFGNDFHFEIIDEGDGFDYKSVPDPTSRNNLIKPSGRGIFIIRHFCDKVNWKKGGRHLTASLKKHPDFAGKRNHSETLIRQPSLFSAPNGLTNPAGPVESVNPNQAAGKVL